MNNADLKKKVSAKLVIMDKKRNQASLLVWTD